MSSWLSEPPKFRRSFQYRRTLSLIEYVNNMGIARPLPVVKSVGHSPLVMGIYPSQISLSVSMTGFEIDWTHVFRDMGKLLKLIYEVKIAMLRLAMPQVRSSLPDEAASL